jgi:hypothetical protein
VQSVAKIIFTTNNEPLPAALYGGTNYELAAGGFNQTRRGLTEENPKIAKNFQIPLLLISQ